MIYTTKQSPEKTGIKTMDENITDEHHDWINELLNIYGSAELIKYICEDVISKQERLTEHLED